jgi:hypothetical protein
MMTMTGRSSLRATDEQATFSKLARSEVRGEADRARAMLLTLSDWTSAEIAEAFGVTADSVRHWRQWFAEDRVGSLALHLGRLAQSHFMPAAATPSERAHP